MCTHRFLDHPDGLPCLLPDHPEHPNGHSYAATGAPDGHDSSEARAEADHA